MARKDKAMREQTIEVGPAVLVSRRVENPMQTDAMLQAALDAGVAGGVAGWIDVPVNLVTLIGGLARMSGVSREQQVAAARYRALFERAQIGGARATDYAAVRVDVSGSGRDIVEDGAAARRDYLDAVQTLGLWQSSLLEKVVCHNMSVREVARVIGEGVGGAARARTQRRVVQVVEVLVDHFGGGRRRVVGEGERALWAAVREPLKAH